MLTPKALEELRRLIRGLPTEDGRDYVDDMVIWAAEHGDDLLRKLEVPDAAVNPVRHVYMCYHLTPQGPCSRLVGHTGDCAGEW